MKISESQSDVLNLTRWVAAWLVVAEHARSLMFADYAECGSSGIIAKGFYFMTGFGHEAVMIFFVISGYLVGGKAVSKFSSKKFAWRGYLIDRASRLYAVLLVALIAGGALDWVGSRYFDEYGLYSFSMPESVAVVSRSFSEGLSIASFVGNLSFLQTVLVEPFGSNGPLWSLAYEWWYYLLFPLALTPFFVSGFGRIGGILGFALLAVFLPSSILVLFGVWLIGVGASLLRTRISILAAVALCLGALAIARLELIQTAHIDQYLIGVGYAVLLVSLAGSESRLPLHALSRNLADFSYSTYLVHFPLLVFVLSLGYSLTGSGLRMDFSAGGVMIFIALISFAIFVSWGVSLFTEAKTVEIREMMKRLTGIPCRERKL